MGMLMDIRKLYGLDGKVAIVTGAAQGMGAAIARYLAGMGATVALVDIKMPQAEENAATIIAEGGQARAYHVDMAEIGRASCRERVWQDVEITVGGVRIKKTIRKITNSTKSK